MHRSWPEHCILPEGRYVVVGDLQNGYGAMPYLEERTDLIKLFIGDYLDSWIATPAAQVRELQRILNLIERGEAVAVWGNHDAHYFGPGFIQGSGYNSTTKALVTPMRQQMEKLIRPFLYHEKHRILFTHAGVTKKLWDAFELDFDSLVPTLHGWSLNYDSPFFNIGYGRGGRGIGGPLWCDWHTEFVPVPGLAQVVGHTGSFHKKQKVDGDRWGNLRCKGGNSWNTDCLGRDDSYDFLIFDTSDASFSGLSVEKPGNIYQSYPRS